MLCVNFVRFSARFHKAYGYDQTEQYHPKPWGCTTRYVALVRHEKEITMVELFEERLCELVRNFKHIVFLSTVAMFVFEFVVGRLWAGGRAVVLQLEDWWFDSRLLQSTCRCVLGQDT